MATFIPAYKEMSKKIDQSSYWLAQIQTLNAAVEKERSTRIEVENQCQQLSDRAQALSRLSKHLNCQMEVQAVLTSLCQIAMETFQVPTAFITRYDQRNQLLFPACSTGLGAQEIANLKPITLTRFKEQLDQSGPKIYSRPHPEDGTFPYPEFLPDSREIILATVSLVEQESLFGILHLAVYNSDRHFSEGELDLLQAFASYGMAFLSKACLFEQVRAGRNRLQRLSQKLLEVQETERHRLACELHDEIGQSLTSIKTLLDLMLNEGNRQKGHKNLFQAKCLTQQLLDQVREIALDLRPALLDDLGLLPALHLQFERFTDQTNIQVSFFQQGVDQRFSSQIETAAYRIVQEALTNAARYARVEDLVVRLRSDGKTLLVQIEDQGAGFDPQMALSSGTTIGLSGMHERALLLGGYLNIESQVGKGTRLTAEFPLTEPIERRLNDRKDLIV